MGICRLHLLSLLQNLSRAGNVLPGSMLPNHPCASATNFKLLSRTFSSSSSPFLSRNVKNNHLPKIPIRTLRFLNADSEKTKWTTAVSEAEKLVGYPTSFMSLRCLLSDELANVALQVRKLVGTKHPLVQTAKNFVYDGHHSLQTRGLVVLLISKAAGPGDLSPDQMTESSGIHSSQRSLAEIVEMIHTAFLVHQGVVDLADITPEDGPLKVMDFGNKMAVLSGDYLLATACMGLAQMKSPKTVETISEVITHMTQGAFANIHAKANNVAFSDWKDLIYLSSGSLIGKSCKAALELANHDEELCHDAFEFGRNLAWAKQMHQDVAMVTSNSASTIPEIFAPAVVYTEMKGSEDVSDMETQRVFELLRSNQVMERCRELSHTFTTNAMKAISSFPETDAKSSLQKIVQAVQI